MAVHGAGNGKGGFGKVGEIGNLAFQNVHYHIRDIGRTADRDVQVEE